MLIFIDLDNYHVITHIYQDIGPSQTASLLDFTIIVDVDNLVVMFSDKVCDVALLHLVRSHDGIVWMGEDVASEAEVTVGIV